MKIEKRASGLVVPAETPKVKKRRPTLEIEDEEKREAAALALADLWDALDLSQGEKSIFGNPNYAAHYQAYMYIAKMLLGKDAPEKEILC